MAIRKRIGLMVPSTNTTCEPGFYMAAPRDVTIHTYRLLREPGLPAQLDALKRMNQDIEPAVKYLTTAKVDVLAYACTSGSFSWGPGHDLEMIRQMEESGGVPAVATATAVVEALRFFGARKISVATPYPENTNQRLRAFFEGAEFQVLNVDGEPTASQHSQGITDQEPQRVLEFSAQVCRPEADALLLSCTGWRALEVVGALEQRLGIPVVTANQSTIWAAFRKLGVTQPIKGFGRLLESLATVKA